MRRRSCRRFRISAVRLQVPVPRCLNAHFAGAVGPGAAATWPWLAQPAASDKEGEESKRTHVRETPSALGSQMTVILTSAGAPGERGVSTPRCWTVQHRGVDTPRSPGETLATAAGALLEFSASAGLAYRLGTSFPSWLDGFDSRIPLFAKP